MQFLLTKQCDNFHLVLKWNHIFIIIIIICVIFCLLTLENKLDIVRLLFPIAHKWKEIGESLSIRDGDLENLRDERSRNTDRLSGVIQIWFDKRTCQVKWSTLITAVELPPVYEPSIAQNILEKCKSIIQN